MSGTLIGKEGRFGSEVSGTASGSDADSKGVRKPAAAPVKIAVIGGQSRRKKKDSARSGGRPGGRPGGGR